MSLLAQIQTQPYLLKSFDGMIIAEPLCFISAQEAAAFSRLWKRLDDDEVRHANQDALNKKVVHS